MYIWPVVYMHNPRVTLSPIYPVHYYRSIITHWEIVHNISVPMSFLSQILLFRKLVVYHKKILPAPLPRVPGPACSAYLGNARLLSAGLSL